MKLMGQLIINSIRNKFEIIAEIIKDFDNFVISESKVDSIFPNSQLKITGIKFLDMTQTYLNDNIIQIFD